jgi:SAM-dependent methyltransferase
MFNQINVDNALAYTNETPSAVLVVGSGQGSDIICLRERLGPEPLIVGVDIDIHPEDFPAIANTLILQIDITKQSVLGNCFDLAYSFATFEHIHDIQQGWQAMLNMLRPGGLLWSVASPLWMSPFGHHKPFFNKYPWAHVLNPDPQSLHRFAQTNNILPDDNIDILHHVDYIFNPSCFNRLPPAAYSQAAEMLQSAAIEANQFDYIDESGLEAQIASLEAVGYNRLDLLALTHRLIARRT